uniref:Uncharacterized protein n=1 Tax=Anguilla anguilla TaxID=7936 RepID=A0A0E9PVT6_ANGAN
MLCSFAAQPERKQSSPRARFRAHPQT